MKVTQFKCLIKYQICDPKSKNELISAKVNYFLVFFKIKKKKKKVGEPLMTLTLEHLLGIYRNFFLTM